MRRRRAAALLGLAWLAAVAGCEGSGDAGDGLRIRSRPGAGCGPAAGRFPSGLAEVPGRPDLASLVQSSPPGLVAFDVGSSPPTPRAFANIGTDSDGDGRDDAEANEPFAGFAIGPTMGGIQPLREGLALVSTSSYEQLLFVDPATGAPVEVEVAVPEGVPPERHPLLPAPGGSARRTGLSTLACVVRPGAVDSEGQPVAPEPLCDPARASWLTNLTSGKALAAGRLFVATSNLLQDARFLPASVAVFEWSEDAEGIRVRPSARTPFLFPDGYNATGLARVETPAGRELVLVTVTGAIGSQSGASNVRSEAGIAVIDPRVPRIAAHIPLGFAGPSFEAPAVDPLGRIAWLGASSQRRVYAVDLRALDTPALYGDDGPPVLLDGRSPGFPDARIFTGDHPLEIPARRDRPSLPSCEGFTHVALDSAGSELRVTDFCDGTLTRVRIDPSGSPPLPYPRTRFSIAGQTTPFAPHQAIGERRAPGPLLTRPGTPGIDFEGPDVLVTIGQPEASLCGLWVE